MNAHFPQNELGRAEAYTIGTSQVLLFIRLCNLVDLKLIL